MARRTKAQKILLLSVAMEMTEEQINCVRKISAGFSDWQELLSLAEQHRLLPLLVKNMQDHCYKHIPPEILNKWKRICKDNSIKNLMMTGHLLRTLALLKADDIPAIPFKGPVLATTLYKDPGLRVFSDIDLLIHKKNLPKTVELLKRQGFVALFDLNEKQLTKLALTDNEFPLAHRENNITLDLQWEISGGYFPRSITIDDLSLKDIFINRVKISSFANEDLLFYLCIHGNQHTWNRLDHICSLAELMRLRDLNWHKIFTTAKKYKAVRILTLGLLLAEEFFNISPPAPYASLVKKELRTTTLAEQLANKLLKEENDPPPPVNHRFMKYHFLSMDSPFLALRYALRLFFLPTRFDWQLYPLPARLSFCHYIIRPFRLLGATLKSLTAPD